MELPVCRWRGAETTEGRYGCSSPKLRVSALGVAAATCMGCSLRDHEPGTELPAPVFVPPAVPYLSPKDKLRTCVHRGRSLKENGQPLMRLASLG